MCNRLIYFHLLIILLAGCGKEDRREPEFHCITGSWNCVYFINMSGNDTMNFFENGVVHTYWYGVRQYSTPAEFTMEMESDSFRLVMAADESIPLLPLINDEFSPWKLLNTSISNTLLDIHLLYGTVFEIIEINDDELIIESNQYNFHTGFIFERAGPCSGGEFTMDIDQYPKEIIGNWQLDELLFMTNDSVFSRYEDDTLVIQYYIGVRDKMVKVVDKAFYSADIFLGERGYMTLNETRGTDNYFNNNYWYWADNYNPHNIINFRPVDFHLPCFIYQITSLSPNRMELANDSCNISMKLTRK